MEVFHQGAAVVGEVQNAVSEVTVRYPNCNNRSLTITNINTTTTVATAVTTVVAAVVGVKKSCGWRFGQARQARRVAAAAKNCAAFTVWARH